MWLMLLFGLGVSMCAGAGIASIGDAYSRLAFLLHTGALICGLLILILVAPVVFG
jgi:hypothetical protein